MLVIHNQKLQFPASNGFEKLIQSTDALKDRKITYSKNLHKSLSVLYFLHSKLIYRAHFIQFKSHPYISVIVFKKGKC